MLVMVGIAYEHVLCTNLSPRAAGQDLSSTLHLCLLVLIRHVGNGGHTTDLHVQAHHRDWVIVIKSHVSPCFRGIAHCQNILGRC